MAFLISVVQPALNAHLPSCGFAGCPPCRWGIVSQHADGGLNCETSFGKSDLPEALRQLSLCTLAPCHPHRTHTSQKSKDEGPVEQPSWIHDPQTICRLEPPGLGLSGGVMLTTDDWPAELNMLSFISLCSHHGLGAR